MKNRVKKSRTRVNGTVPSREELLAAHKRLLKHDEKLTAPESFKALVEAGILTRKGKLTTRYGG